MRTQTLIALLLLCFIPPAMSASNEIDAYVQEALAKFRIHTPAGAKLAASARGILVFPKVYKAGFVIGGEYGEGALLVNGGTQGYYSIAAGSFGLQVGAQRKSQIILFMTDAALATFRNSKGWQAGVDGSVAIATLGAGDKIDTETAKQPIVGFIFSNEGLMFNLTLEGAKITPINR